MKKLTKKKLTLDTTTIARLTHDQLAEAAGGLQLTRPYTKVSACTNHGACPTEVCR